MSRASFLLLAAGALACDPGFDDASLVKDLRVLAVRADPPEILIDPAAPALPPPVTLTPLVIDPQGGGRPIGFSTLPCLNAPDLEGGFGPGSVRGTVSRGGCEPDPAAPLTEAAPGAISFEFAPTVELIMAAVMADPLGVYFGIPVTIGWRFRAGDEDVTAGKRVLYSPLLTSPDGTPHTPNRNPTIERIVAYGDFDSRRQTAAVFDPSVAHPLGLGGTLHLQPCFGEAGEAETCADFEPTVNPREHYVAQILDRETRTLAVRTYDETLRFSYFTNAGSMRPQKTNTEPPRLLENAKIRVESTYVAPVEMPADPLVTIWIVVRDERGGSSWTTRTIRLE